MAKKAKILGLREVMNNLNKEINAIKGRTMKGLIESAIIVRADMERTPPKVPIDTGNLRQSWFTTSIKKLNQIGLIMGFNANYALFVHEMLDDAGKKINWNRPGSGPKFLESSLKRNEKLILQTIAKNAKIK